MKYKQVYEQWVMYPHLEKNLKQKLGSLSEAEIEDAFYTDLQFGTGGMRGEVGPGTNRMNIYTIRKANVGFAKYLLEHFKSEKERGVVIAYDNRHYSKEFAYESAKVMASYGIKAYLFDELRPTPELSFAVRHLNAIGGIVITASHNPPQYNGYKIYDESGCQLTPKAADSVIRYVNEVEDIFSISLKEEEELNQYIEVIGSKLDDAYVEKVKNIQIHPEIKKSDLKVVFTPLHGTANKLARRILAECGYEAVFPVLSQCVNDPNFSTVKSPNPEDGEAFALAIELGEQVDADVLIATDPDADRVGLAVKNNEGNYILLTGNQTGALLIDYIAREKTLKNILPKQGMVYNTIVTSTMGAEIAQKYGLEVESTLTGFKFIGEQARAIEGTEKEFVFGYEESYGYLIADFVRDKDSLQSLLMCCEMAAFYKNQGKTLYDVLFELYDEHGYYIESLLNITLKGVRGQSQIKRIISEFRSDKPKTIGNLNVIICEDYLEGIRYTENGEEPLTLPQSNVLKFILDDESLFVLRPSGTEPKLKIYVGVVSKDLDTSEQKNEEIKSMLKEKIDAIIKREEEEYE